MTDLKSKIDSNIQNRKSYFSFSDSEIEEEKLQIVFEAARWAPSSFNAQPWRYIYARKKEPAYDVLFDLLSEKNKMWAGTAAVLILSLAEVFDKKRQRTNRFAFHDLGLSTSMLLLQAVSLGICTHTMGGYDIDKAKKVLNIPEEFETGAMIALGYPGNPSLIPEEFRQKQEAQQIRKEMDDIFLRGSWKEK